MAPLGLFGIMVHERPPPQAEDLPGMVVSWLYYAGGLAAFGLSLWLIAYVLRRWSAFAYRQPEHWLHTLAHRSALGQLFSELAGHMAQSVLAGREKKPAVFKWVFGVLLATAGLCYFAAAVWWLSAPSGGTTGSFLLALAGGCALLAAALPCGFDLVRLRLRRIFALASLTFREAVRHKALWLVAFVVPVFLFADWYLQQKPEDQLRTYVEILYWAMTPLLVVAGVVLASFGIPDDIRHQTIHTILTKPVERFELVLGRFLGYVALLSVLLGVLTLLSFGFLAIPGRLHPASVRESWRARVPLYGELTFQGRTAGEKAGISVGKEWDYRRWIPGGPGTQARAVWTFTSLPGRLDERTVVPCEFSFDIFRTSRGEENKGVFATFMFETWRWSPAKKLEYDNDYNQMKAELAGKPLPAAEQEIRNRLAAKHGYYEIKSKEVFNQQTFAVDIPAGLFKNAQTPDRQPFLVKVYVRCDTPAGFLGMAKHDLYLVDGEGQFWWNFCKGAAGLWFRLCLIVGLATACSTYLSGVVSLITAGFLFLGGLAREFIQSVAAGAAEGGGPAESFLRLVQRQGLTAPLPVSPTSAAAGGFDEGFRWMLQHLLPFIPDVWRFDLSAYVAEGFDISYTLLGLCIVQLVGYLLPWMVLAYYMMKAREVAG